MEQQNGNNGWQPPQPNTGSGGPINLGDSHSQLQQRSVGGYGPTTALQQGPPMPMAGQVSLPCGSFYNNQPNENALPTLAGLAQSSPPRQVAHPPHPIQQHSPTSVQHHQPQGMQLSQQAQGHGYPLPGIGQAIQHVAGEREYREAEIRESEQRLHDAMIQQEHDRDRERERERERDREREQQEQRANDQMQATSEAHAASIPLQQPIASRIPSTLHGPNGILSSNPNVGASLTASSTSIGASNGSVGMFSHNGLGAHDGMMRSFLQPHSNGQQQLSNFGSSTAAQQLSAGLPPVSQAQQPILNDALSYLDLVKVRFMDQPDVYNKFLDIMKDFKSQAIDTPGVINRVSTLFNGHPELIQGFNTFLPPGYKIECGLNDDPNSIRVTTPMGTTVSSLNNMPMQISGGHHGGPNGVLMESSPGHAENSFRAVEGRWQQSTAADHPPEGLFSPNSRATNQQLYGQHAMPRQPHLVQYTSGADELVAAEAAQAAAIAHQREQHGVSQLTSAVSVAADGRPSMQLSPNGASAGSLGPSIGGSNNVGLGLPVGSQINAEKRGPVEFNHAISYVNKIKNRFATQPEIYKQFLEILQIYQRESKPIQDVYAQVTQLFNAAPDLLEDFKQFLPESAAHAKAQAAAARQATEDAAMLSHVRGEASYVAGIQSLQVHTPRPEAKMPPIGNFAPPSSVGKDNKKRRGGAGSQITIGGSAAAGQDLSSVSGQGGRNNGISGNAPKRARVSMGKPPASEMSARSPTLIPELPYPLPPTTNLGTTAEEIAFFDRVKKYVGNKSTFNEFLKLCNLFTQDLIDKTTLVHKADNFIGQNVELMSYFKNLAAYAAADKVIENRPAQSDVKVVLSNCRALGPSYRLLPKREQFAKCSGRDQLCASVLNDQWASHPTWASEDSGFVSHRKNPFEEALHRMEEERHDYDFNVETCLRTILLLEPIVQSMNLLSEEDKRTYKLPPGLGGQSEAIFSRVIKKIYDRQKGSKVIEDMFIRPTAVCPVILARLKQKAEEWKAGQREWEKVWRDQTHKQFWKSLDHQGIGAKAENKRQFQPKTLQTDIQTKYEEQKRQRLMKWTTTPKYQFDFTFDDVDVILDACHILLTYLHYSNGGNLGDQARAENFFKTFIPTFFGLDKEVFVNRMSDIYNATPPNEEMDEDFPTNEESSAHRGRRAANGKKANLLRGVLDRSQQGKQGRKDRDNHGAKSKESTPEVTSMDEGSITPVETPSEQPSRHDNSENRWMEHPSSSSSRNRLSFNVNEPFARDAFSLYANLNIYCFIRMFESLYERLVNIKKNEAQVHEDVRRAKAPKAAIDLKMAERSPSEFFPDTKPTANFYQQIVKMCEDIVKGEEDMSHIEETLRRFYLANGWKLYNFDKMLQAIIRFALLILGNDNKDRSGDIMNLYYKNRKDVQTTHQSEIDYRKAVEKIAKDTDMYRLIYNQSTQHATIQVFKKDDKTFDTDEMTAQSKWSYYVTSYVMNDWTEGVSHEISWPFLRRNLPKDLETEEDYGKTYLPQWNQDGLTVKVCPNSYHLLWDEGTDWFFHDTRVSQRGLGGMAALKDERKDQFEEKFVKNAKWMAGMNLDEVTNINTNFNKWVKGPEAVSASAVNGDGDDVMTGT